MSDEQQPGQAPDMEDRYRNEAEFFDRSAARIMDGKTSYKLTNTKNHAELFQSINQFKPVVPFFGDIAGKRILEVACGNGWISLYLARSGAEVHCCDISPKSIELARRHAEANDVADRMHPAVMTAENLEYEDNSFDYVFVNAALHHTDIPRATAEIKRVLKDGGKGAFIEDFGYHPALVLYRLFTAAKHTDHERPLYYKDLDQIGSLFSRMELHYSGLLDIFDRRNALTTFLGVVDRGLLALPFLRPFSRLVGILVVK